MCERGKWLCNQVSACYDEGQSSLDLFFSWRLNDCVAITAEGVNASNPDGVCLSPRNLHSFTFWDQTAEKAGVLVRYGLLRACVWGVINATEDKAEEDKEEEEASSTSSRKNTSKDSCWQKI